MLIFIDDLKSTWEHECKVVSILIVGMHFVVQGLRVLVLSGAFIIAPSIVLN